MEKPPENRQQRRAAKAEGKLDTAAFLKLADRFIDLANRENSKVNATDLQMAFLYAATRYSAHVAKNVMKVTEHEPYIDEMNKQFLEMLRNHLADPNV